MWLKATFLSVFLWVPISVFAEEKPECGAAVDAADRLAPDSDKHCDYTKTGLNGILHRAFKEKSDEPDVIKNSKENNNQKAAMPSKNDTELSNSSEFSNAQQLQSVRFRLIQNAAKECQKGFVVESERYLPTQTKSLVLDLVYHCL